VDSRTVTDTILNTAGCDSVISIELNSLNPNLDVGVYEDRLEAKPGYSKYQWYDCYRNSPILGATHNIFHPKRAGLYYGEITNGTCTYITSCYSISSDGINKQLNNNVRAYPNPSEGKTTLEFEHEHKTITVSILNLQGQVISIQEFHNTYWLEIDLPPNAGCYIIRTEVAGFPSKSVRVFHL
jgi:beta-galactosidase